MRKLEDITPLSPNYIDHLMINLSYIKGYLTGSHEELNEDLKTSLASIEDGLRSFYYINDGVLEAQGRKELVK